MDDMDFKDKKVLVRLGTDMPVDDNGDITDDLRIRVNIPTIKYLLEKDPKQIILLCHIGRPKKPEQNLTTEKTAKKMSEILGQPIKYIDNWGEKGLPDDKIVFLENARFNKREKSKDEKERKKFGKKLAKLADIFVMDGFNNMHHPDQASMSGVLSYIPACIGLLPEKEISIISEALENPKKPFVSIIGGMKAEKLNAVKGLIDKVDYILIGGGLAFTLLNSMGKNVGATKVDKEGLEEMKDLIELVNKTGKVVLPVDAVIADKFDENANNEIVDIDNIKEDWMALDIGPKTIEKWEEILKKAKTVIFNGPPGVYEWDSFANGTKLIAETMTQIDGTTIVGGGDSADSVKKFGDEDKITLVSSGGGASLTLFEGEQLGEIIALEKNYKKFRDSV